MIVLIDHYDSFVYNLARYVVELGYSAQVIRHDAVDLSAIEALEPSHILLSPGPGTPDESPLGLALVAHYSGRIPLLGVCLGHQIIAQACGARVVRAKHPMHGMSSSVVHDQQGLFRGLDNPITVGRYHALIVSDEDFPEETLRVTARETPWAEGEIMALEHKKHPTYGVQFHPESILTEHGDHVLEEFLRL